MVRSAAAKKKGSSEMADWCWLEWKCECSDSADPSILWTARAMFNNDNAEYRKWAGFGLDWNGNGKKEVNCNELVRYTLEALGYHTPDYFHWRWEPSSAIFDKYFCRVEYADAQRGDIIYFDSQPGIPGSEHIGIIDTKNPNGSEWVGLFYSALDPARGMGTALWKSDQDPATYPLYVSGIYRPKVCHWQVECDFPWAPTQAPVIWRLDPLILDL
jgi:hypothetical protein